MRTLTLLAFLTLSGALLAACGAPAKCGPGSCTGCCDATGQCQGGSANAACGSGGLACNTCSLAQSCTFGVCGNAGTGGGTSTGGGGGTSTGGGGGTSTGGGGGTSTGGGGGTSTGGGGGSSTGGGGGSSTGGGSGGGSGSTFETWCASYVNSICDVAGRCGLYSSASVCRSSVGASLACATTPAMRDGRTVFDSSLAATCLNQLNTAACDAVDIVTGCAPALHGAVALNGACYGSNECANNLFCDTSTTCPGLCHAAGALGQPPTAGSTCVTGAVAYNSVCVAPTPVGQSCAPAGSSSDRPCVAGAFCSAAKVCTAKRLTGQTCTAGSYAECAGLSQCNGGVCGGLGALSAPCDSARRCMGDLYCGPTNVCVALGTLNTACSSISGQCQGNLIRDIPAGMTTGTCQAIHTLGQSCTYFGYQCGFTGQLYCTATSSNMSGVCAMQKGPGASCQSYQECTSSSCTNSVCTGCVDPTP